MSSHLKEFTIESFRGLRDVKLEGLGRFNLIVGENNSGKTSTLEALMLFLAPGDTRNWIRLLSFRDIGLSSRSAADLVSWLFPIIDRDHPDERHEISIQGLIGEANEMLSLSYRHEIVILPPDDQRHRRRFSEELEDEPGTNKIAYLLARHFSEITGERSGEIVFGVQSPRHRMITPATPKIESSFRRVSRRPLAVVKPHSHRIGRAAVGAVSNAVMQRMKDFFIHVLQIFDPAIVGVDVVSSEGDPLIVLEHRDLGIVPVHIFGDGLRKAVVILGQAIEAEGGILILDEVETALHHSIQAPFFNALREITNSLDVQIIATTHSLDAVDGIISSMNHDLNDLVAFHLPDKGSDQSIKRLSGDIMKRLRFERGLDLR